MVVLLCGCARYVPPNPNAPKPWEASFSKADGQTNNVFDVTQTNNGGCTFAFPVTGHINYLTRLVRVPAKSFLEVKIQVDGQATFVPLDGGDPATIHLYLEEGTLFNNWWCDAQFFVLPDIIGKGIVAIKVPLTPDAWANVSGQMANSSPATLAQFNKAKQVLWDAGMTFGGKSAYGHGVRVKGGSAKFTLISFAFVD